MSRTITDSNIEKKGKKFYASADWRDGNEGGTERETFDTFDAATEWINKLEAESDRADDSSPAKNGNSETDEEPAVASGTATPPVPLPGEDTSNRGDQSHSPSAEGHTPNAVPTATDADTLPEPAASDMNPADAENINSNINPAPSTVVAGNDAISNPNPFGNPITDGQTAADTQAAPTDHDTSHEVNGVQDPNDTESATANAGQEKTTDTSNAKTAN